MVERLNVYLWLNEEGAAAIFAAARARYALFHLP